MSEQFKATTMRLPMYLVGLLFFAFLAMFFDAPSDDLRSVWLAGQYFDSGPAGVYAGSLSTFNMAPPDLWIDAVVAQDVSRPVYPFIYPPLWAWAAELVTGAVSFDQFKFISTVINAALVSVSLLLACRITNSAESATVFIVVGLVICATSIVVLLPMEQNQPQILVSFLILLAIERERSGYQLLGGLALALAAAIKLYPAIFAIFWLCAGRRTAFASFTISGAILGLISVYVAGWPLHRAFLHEISTISSTVLFSAANFSFDPLIAYLFVGQSNMTEITSEVTGGTTNWHVYQKSTLWNIASIAAQLAGVALLGVLSWRTRLKDPLFWPVAILVVSWFSPLSWLYHYLTAFFFLPVLLLRFGVAIGTLLVLAVLVPTMYVFGTVLISTFERSAVVVLGTNFSLFLATLSFLVAMKLRGDKT
jgi:alpha-1,2-mannosyltransferase